MDKLKPLVIVLSRNYSTGLGVIRSIGAAGYPVELIASVKKKGSSVIASSSKYVRKTTEVLAANIQKDSGEELIKAIMKYVGRKERKKILFPTDDFTTSVLDAHRDLLKTHFMLPHIVDQKYGSITEFMKKTVQSELAREVGLYTPHEWVISLRSEICIPRDMVYPCFVKPLQSVSGYKTEMRNCVDEKELKKHLFEMKNAYADRDILVQEYLHIDKEYDLSGVCLDQQIIAPLAIEKTGIAQYERGVARSGKVISAEILSGTKEKIESLLKKFHYVGMFDMDLNLCGGKVYFGEINFRSGGLNFAYYLSGVNFPAIFIKGICGEKLVLEDISTDTLGKTFVYEKVVWEDYIYNYINRQELRKYIRSVDFKLLENDEDPMPGRYFNSRIRLSALKHKWMSRLTRTSDTSDLKKQKEICVIVGRNYGNILTMARDLGTAGYDIEVVRLYKKKPRKFNVLGRMKPEAYCKYVKKYSTCIVNDNIQGVVDVLVSLSLKNQKKLLMPTDDYSACIVDENLETLKLYYFLPNIRDKQGEIVHLMDKNEQKKMAKKFNLPLLQSCLICANNGEIDIPEDIQYPCFIKPNISMASTKAKMAKCSSEKELLRILRRYAQVENFEMLAEDFVEIKNEYAILGISMQEIVLVPGIFKTNESGHKERKGVALTGEIVSTEKFQNIIEQCCKFVGSLDYTGLFDIDLIEAGDGKIYFVELNFRAGASTHVVTEAGANLPAMLADYFFGKASLKEQDISIELGKRFVSEKILLEEYVRSDVDFRKVKTLMKEAEVYFIKDVDDPKPYCYFRKYYAVAAMLRIPYKIRDYGREKELRWKKRKSH